MKFNASSSMSIRPTLLARIRVSFACFIAVSLLTSVSFQAADFAEHAGHVDSKLPNLDKRTAKNPDKSIDAKERAVAKAKLKERLSQVQVDVDPVVGSPASIVASDGFLTGPNGRGRAVSEEVARAVAGNDPHHAIKAFLREYKDLYGHGPEATEKARLKRDYVAANNGLRTVMWEQEVDGIPVLDATLVGHISRNAELVTISSHFLPEPERAADAGVGNRKAVAKNPPISAERAISLASENLGEPLSDSALAPPISEAPGPEAARRFKGKPLVDEADVRLVWLPIDRKTLRLCWQVALKRLADGGIYRLMVDAQTGEVVVRHSLTFQLTDASYRIFTGASPAPWLPGPSSPTSSQASTVSRQLVTLSALNTTASPLGWINDGDNETKGNNVLSYVTSVDDSRRPKGTTFRVFDYALDLGQAPSTYANASAVNAFYWFNWSHDKLYELGFTEAAGNYQKDNFARGGGDTDMIISTIQESVTENAYFNAYVLGDGNPGYIHSFVWPSAEPDRDGGLDTQVLLHEYNHAMQVRYCLSYAVEANGMYEGWSDFFALALLSQSGDDPNGAYPVGQYVTYRLGASGFDQNYYFGIRRYPYSTDMAKNPLTYGDIVSERAEPHLGVPRSPISGTSAEEVHRIGEVWCSILWDVRAALIQKHGYSVGNQRALQLVHDGMKLLGPGSFGFISGRAMILQADLINYANADYNEIWAAFAKRGVGVSAFSQPHEAFVNVVPAYDLPVGVRKLLVHLRGQDAAHSTMPMFSVADIRYLPNLAYSLHYGSSALSAYIWTRLPPATQSLISGYVTSGYSTDPKPVMQALAVGLDVVLKEGPLYDINRFAGVRLSDETTWRLAQNPTGGALVRLNRMLLDDAWATHLYPSLAYAPESAGVITVGGTARITQTLGSALTVNLTSSRPDYMTVPASVSIPAGQLEANFTVTILNNSVSDGNHYAHVTATAAGLSGATAGVQLKDDEVDHFEWNVVSSPQQAGQSFTVTATAKDPQNNTVTSFAGTAGLTGWEPAPGAASVVISKVHVTSEAVPGGAAGSGYVDFANVSSGSVTMDNWQILLYDKVSWPNPQQTIVLPAASVSQAGQTFRLFVRPATTLQWNHPGVYSNFYAYATIGWNQGAGSNPIAVMLRDASGNIVDFMCAADAVPSQITNPSTIPASVWNGGAIPAAAAVPGYYQRQGSADHNNRTDWVTGSFADVVPPPSIPAMTLPYTSLRPVTISPTSSGTFVNGVWSGAMTVSTFANSMLLRAEDAAGHGGDSAAFSVSRVNDIGVSVAASLNRVTPGNVLAYTITVTNTGPGSATSVTVSDPLPGGTTFESASATQGSCSVNAGVVTCSLGTLAGSAGATATVAVRVGAVGTVVNNVTVSRAETDAFTGNNAAAVSTAVTVPVITASHFTVTEGNSGFTAASVPVTLSGSNTVSVSFNYSTLAYPAGARVATAGSDYVVSSGVVTFPAGVTSATIPLQIIGDTLIEDFERFALILSSPVNGELAATRYRIHITDDDGTANPSLTIGNVTVTEGDSGTTTATFIVSLTSPIGKATTVSYRTEENTAIEARDYEPTFGTLVFQPGTTTLSIPVPVRGDTYFEGNETFNVRVYANTFGTPTLGLATGTITDDDSGKLHGFAIGSVSNPQHLNCPVSLTVLARDGAGFPFTTFSGNASLRGRIPGATTTIGIAPLMSLGDIANLTSLGSRLKQPNSYDYSGYSLSLYLRTRFSQATLDLLANYFGGESATLRQALTTELNTVIQGVSIYDPSRFAYVVLRPETDKLRQQNPSGALLIRLNRLLLEDAYGTDLAQFEWDFPTGTVFEDQRVQAIYRASEIGSSGQIRTVALNVDRPPAQDLTAWTIRMKHTTLADYLVNPQWESSGWTTVYQGTTGVYSNGWFAFHLTAPFAYNGTDNLMVDFSFNNSDWTRDGLCSSSSDTVPRSLVLQADSSQGDPLSWAGTTPPPKATNRYPNVRLSFETPIAVSPTSIGPFVNGYWTGPVTISQLASGMQFVVNDANNHIGAGMTFDVVGINAAPSFVKGPDQTVLRNSGSQTVPAWATLISPGPSETWQAVDFIVSNNNNPLFSVQPAVSPTGTLTFTPAANATGTATVSVQIHDNGGTDCGGVNLSAVQTFVISVTAYSVSIVANDAVADEPDTATDNGQFTVTRSGGDNSQAMTVYYSTSGTATPGSDYTALPGSVVIPATQSSAVINVTVLNDSLYEWNETVTATLSANAAYVVASPSTADVTIYSFLDLGVLPGGTASRAFGINDAGRAVGYSSSASGTKAFRSTPNQALASGDDLHPAVSQLFGSPGQGSSAAWDISTSDRLVGEWSYNGTNKAWYRSLCSGSPLYQPIALSGATANYLKSVNDWTSSGGEGAGYSTLGGLNRFCHWYIYDCTTNYTYAYNLGSSYWPSYNSYALGVYQGRVVGYVGYPTGNKAVIWDWNYSSSGPTYLVGPYNSVPTEAYDIAPYYYYYYIVGFADTSGQKTACYWSYSGYSASGVTATLLAKPSGWNQSIAVGINNANKIVGNYFQTYSPTDDGERRASLWDGGTLVLLNDFVPGGSGWVLNSAERINGLNQIVGYGSYGGQFHAFRLKP